MIQIFAKLLQRKIFFALLWLLPWGISFCNAQDIVPTAITPQNSTGDLPYSTSVGSATEHVELATGNLRINIPIVSVPGRKLSFDFGLQYDARYWTIGQVNTGNALFSYWKPELRNWVTSNSLGWTTTEGFLTFASSPRSCIVGSSTDDDGASDGFDDPSSGCNADDSTDSEQGGGDAGQNCDEQTLEDDTVGTSGGGALSLFGQGGGINSDGFFFTDRHGTKHALGINVTTSGESCSIGNYDVSNYSGPSRAMDGFWATSLFGGITVYGPDGLVMPAGGGQQLGSGLLNENTFFSNVLSETDTHGNSQGVGASATDSIGRQPVTMTSSGNQVIYTTESSNGTPQQYTVGLTSIPISTFFNVQGPVPVTEDVETRQVIQSVLLPNGQQYTFQYNDVDAQGHQYGYITHIGLPTGGSVDYTWANVLPCGSGVLVRSVQSRVVNDNSGSHEWDFSYSQECSLGSLQSSTTTVLAPPDVNGIRARTVYSYDINNDLVNIEYGTTSSPQILKALTLTYDTSASLDGASDAPQLVSIQTTLPSGSTGATISNLRTFEYDKFIYARFADGICGSGTDSQEQVCETEGANGQLRPGSLAISHGNVTAVHDYDWAPTGTQGPLLQQTIRTYLTDTNSGYFQTGQNLPYPTTSSQWAQLGPVKSITDKVASETIYDGSVLCHGTAPLNSTGIIAPPPNCTANKIAQTTYIYDTGVPQNYGFLGDLTSATKWLNTGHNIVLSYNYDSYGNLIALHDGNNNPTLISYIDSFSPSGSNNCGVSMATNAYPTTVTNALGQQTTIIYSPCTGSRTNIKDPNDILYGASGTSMSYDGMGRLILATYSDGGQTQTIYNDAANTIETKKLLNGTNNWLTSMTILDELGRTAQMQLTSDPKGTDYTDTTYDGLGRVASVSNPYRSTSDPTYGITSYLYDGLGRKTFQCQPDNGNGNSTVCTPLHNVQSWVYNGNTVTFTDEANHPWQRTSDALGRLTNVVEPNGATTGYVYDALNNLLSVNQHGASGETPRTRSFSYDSLSRLLTATNPETGTINYSYDANSNVTLKTDARGVGISYSYDALNRLLSKSYSSNANGTPWSCYQYDTSVNGIGRLGNEWTQSASKGACPAAAPSSGFITKRAILAYDSMGRLLKEQQSTPASVASGTVYAPAYTYDLAGNLLTSTDGSTPSPTTAGTTLTFTNSYDAAEHLVSVTSNWIDATHPSPLFSLPTTPSTPCGGSSTAPYTPFGALQNATYGSGLTLNRGFDNRLRMTCENDVGSNTAATNGATTVIITGAEQSNQ